MAKTKTRRTVRGTSDEEAASGAKPLMDAIDDAVNAVLELARSLKQRANESGGDTRRAGERIRRAARTTKREAVTRLEKAWDVLVHGDDESSGRRRRR